MKWHTHLDKLYQNTCMYCAEEMYPTTLEIYVFKKLKVELQVFRCMCVCLVCACVYGIEITFKSLSMKL